MSIRSSTETNKDLAYSCGMWCLQDSWADYNRANGGRVQCSCGRPRWDILSTYGPFRCICGTPRLKSPVAQYTPQPCVLICRSACRRMDPHVALGNREPYVRSLSNKHLVKLVQEGIPGNTEIHTAYLRLHRDRGFAGLFLAMLRDVAQFCTLLVVIHTLNVKIIPSQREQTGMPLSWMKPALAKRSRFCSGFSGQP